MGLIIIGIVLLPLIIMFFSKFGRNKMADAFFALGDIRGKPITSLIQKVGKPTSISSSANGNMLYQWMKISGRRSAHYAILVDPDGNAIGYTHQHTT